MAEGIAPLKVPPRPRNPWRTAGIIAALVGFTILTCLPAIGGIDVDFGALVRNWANGATKMKQLLQPNFAFLPRTFAPMLETFAMAIAGAAFAAAVSIPLTLWAARPSNPNRFTRQFVRTIVNINRAVPDLVYATVLVAMVGVGTLPGLVTLFLFDLGIVVKLVSEAIESADNQYIEAGQAAGGTSPDQPRDRPAPILDPVRQPVAVLPRTQRAHLGDPRDRRRGRDRPPPQRAAGFLRV